MTVYNWRKKLELVEREEGIPKDGRISVYAPYPLIRALERYTEADTHMAYSEFVRGAIREKLEEVAPRIIDEEIEKGKEKAEV